MEKFYHKKFATKKGKKNCFSVFQKNGKKTVLESKLIENFFFFDWWLIVWNQKKKNKTRKNDHRLFLGVFLFQISDIKWKFQWKHFFAWVIKKIFEYEI